MQERIREQLVLTLMLTTLINGTGASADTAGRVERIVVHGESLVGNLSGDPPDRFVSVYLPPAYDREPGRRFPVLYFMHGFTNSDDRWYAIGGASTFVNLPVAANKALAAGGAPMIIVMPDAFTRYHGSMYGNSVTTGDWEAFIVEELVAHVDANYRTIPDPQSRGLGGHSMGGFGALRIGMRHPGVFASLYAMNPCCLKPVMRPNPERVQAASVLHTAEEIGEADFFVKAVLASAAAWSPNPQRPPHYFDLPIENGEPRPDVIARWAANAPLAMLDQYVPVLRSYRAIGLEAGDQEEEIGPATMALSEALNRYGIGHAFEIYAGGHRERVAERLEKVVLPFFSEHLRH